MGYKRYIKKAMRKMGVTVAAPGGRSFAQSVFVPRWRLKNYYAVRELGEPHKRWFIEQRYLHATGKFPNLDDPVLFNEKIHWLNLNYDDPRIKVCCDKYRQKEYVASIIGERYTVPDIRVYEKANDIDVKELPKKFAIKVNWGDGPGYSVIVEDRDKVDEDRIKGMMSNAVQPWNNLYYSHFFNGYRDIEPVIYAEEYLEHGRGDIVDYKVHCFNGRARMVLVCEDRSRGKMKKTFFDREWRPLECHRKDAARDPGFPRPGNLEEMLECAEKLADPFPFVRVDFYNIDGHLYVGEMTFHPGLGLEEFFPEEWNRRLGDMLELPEKKK